MADLLSMTGYGSACGSVDGQTITVELKSVNNRYLDCSVRMPKNLLFAEESVKKTISASVSRGKVDVFISAQASQDANTQVSVNHDLAAGYYSAVREIADQLSLDGGVNALSIARFPDVLVIERKEMDKESAEKALCEITAEAVREFNLMRAREGQRLKEDLLSKASEVERLVSVVEERSPQTVREYRERLEERLRTILEDRSIDEARIITEAAIFADRTAVDEETVRLRSHIAQFRSMLESGSPIGRKMDFLVQEFNRESNTIGSKCNDAALAAVVVDLKSEIEKIREQIQNIE